MYSWMEQSKGGGRGIYPGQRRHQSGVSQLRGNENATKAALGWWKGKVPGGQVCAVTMGLAAPWADLPMDPPRSR